MPALVISPRVPFEVVHLVPQEVSDQVLWHSVYGPNAPAPGPGPNGAAAEHQRAQAALQAFAQGPDVAAALMNPSQAAAPPKGDGSRVLAWSQMGSAPDGRRPHAVAPREMSGCWIKRVSRFAAR